MHNKEYVHLIVNNVLESDQLYLIPLYILHAYRQLLMRVNDDVNTRGNDANGRSAPLAVCVWYTAAVCVCV